MKPRSLLPADGERAPADLGRLEAAFGTAPKLRVAFGFLALLAFGFAALGAWRSSGTGVVAIVGWIGSALAAAAGIWLAWQGCVARHLFEVHERGFRLRTHGRHPIRADHPWTAVMQGEPGCSRAEYNGAIHETHFVEIRLHDGTAYGLADHSYARFPQLQAALARHCRMAPVRVVRG